jgi:transcriptional regulator with XRE-family HTH domain
MTTLTRTVSKAEKEIGKRLKEFRLSRKKSQQWLANEIERKLGENVYQSTVADWEAGKLRLHGHLIIEICNLLQIDPSELLLTKESSPLLGNKEILKRLEKINQLKKTEQDTLIKFIDAVLKKK